MGVLVCGIDRLLEALLKTERKTGEKDEETERQTYAEAERVRRDT